jgi:RNA polymerase sigma-70 factor, ECF subfamily
VSKRAEQVDNVIAEGARRLLGRATTHFALRADELAPRIRTAVEKYVLREDANAALESLSSFIDKLQADDLCLIVACERGEETAWNELVERFSATVKSAARSASSNETAAEDLAQSIWAELYGLRTRNDGKPAGKLAYYSGVGSLAGWLRAVVAQLAVDQHRKQSRLVQPEEDAELERLAIRTSPEAQLQTTAGGDPEQAIGDKLAQIGMQDALVRALKDLPDEDRLLVKLYYFDNLRLHEAGAVLGVHEATASRRLNRIHVRLHDRVETILINEQGWTKSETERCFAELAIHLQGDLEPLLAGEGIAPD